MYQIKIITLLTFSCVFLGYSQSKIKGKVVDDSNNDLLSNVIIINLNTKIEIISNTNGTFEITNKGLYAFKKEGYNEKTVDIQSDNYHIIQLSINLSELNEIIINSNLLPKKLKISSATINILSKKGYRSRK